MVYQKMEILSSFIHPYVVPNLYKFLLNTKEDIILKNFGNQTRQLRVAIDFHRIFFSGYQFFKISSFVFNRIKKLV